MASTQSSAQATFDQINNYTRRHQFVLNFMESFTTSQRRAFLRDVYDYARSLGLNKRESKQQVIKARGICGEVKYDTDVSILENEVDDSETILSRLQAPISDSQASTILGHPAVSSLSRQNSRSSTSEDITTQSQKRRKLKAGVTRENSTTSHSSIDALQPAATNRSTNHTKKGRLPGHMTSGNSVIVSRNGSVQRDGLHQSLPRQDSHMERELILTTKPILSYDPTDPEREIDSLKTNTSENKITSHLNVVAIASTTGLPATDLNSKNIENNNQKFDLPEIAMFSDEEDADTV